MWFGMELLVLLSSSQKIQERSPPEMSGFFHRFLCYSYLLMNSLISHGFKLQSGVRKTRPPYSNMAGSGVVHWRILLLAKCPTTTITVLFIFLFLLYIPFQANWVLENETIYEQFIGDIKTERRNQSPCSSGGNSWPSKRVYILQHSYCTSSTPIKIIYITGV